MGRCPGPPCYAVLPIARVGTMGAPGSHRTEVEVAGGVQQPQYLALACSAMHPPPSSGSPRHRRWQGMDGRNGREPQRERPRAMTSWRTQTTASSKSATASRSVFHLPTLWEGSSEIKMKKVRIVGVSGGRPVRDARRFPSTQGCSPYSHAHARGEKLLFSHRSRTILCRPVPNPKRYDSRRFRR
jgi:hypothetical protein